MTCFIQQLTEISKEITQGLVEGLMDDFVKFRFPYGTFNPSLPNFSGRTSNLQLPEIREKYELATVLLAFRIRAGQLRGNTISSQTEKECERMVIYWNDKLSKEIERFY